MKGRYFAEAFAGHGGVSAAARRWGLATREWELQRDPRADLTRPAVLRAIGRDMRTGRVIAIHLGPPCQTFSIAQNRTRCIRSRLEPWGLKNLSAHDRRRVRGGNRTFRAALRLARMAQRCGVPWMIEHPHTAFSWHTAEIEKLSRQPGVVVTVVDQCMFSARWRKRTRLIFGHVDTVDATRIQYRLCKGRAICQRTNRPHLHLEGKNERGVSWTSIASAYPTEMCNAIVHALTASARAKYFKV